MITDHVIIKEASNSKYHLTSVSLCPPVAEHVDTAPGEESAPAHPCCHAYARAGNAGLCDEETDRSNPTCASP